MINGSHTTTMMKSNRELSPGTMDAYSYHEYSSEITFSVGFLGHDSWCIPWAAKSWESCNYYSLSRVTLGLDMLVSFIKGFKTVLGVGIGVSEPRFRLT